MSIPCVESIKSTYYLEDQVNVDDQAQVPVWTPKNELRRGLKTKSWNIKTRIAELGVFMHKFAIENDPKP